MNSKAVFLLIMTFMGAIAASAQIGRYEAGTYISTAGDTLHGYIRDNISLEKSDGFYFKAEKEDKQATFVPGTDFRQVHFKEKEYYSTLADEPKPRIVKGMLGGPTSLYRGIIKGRGDIYFLLEADSIVQLDKDNYRQKVREMASNCTAIDTAAFVRYRHREFLELARQYNACLYPDEPVEIWEEGRKLKFRVGGMLTWNEGNVELGEGNYYRNGTYSRYASFGGGLTGELQLTREFRILAGLTYFRQKVSADSVNVIPYDVPETHSRVTFNLSYLELPVSLQWGWSFGNFRPFAEVGIYLGIPLSRKVEEELMAADPEHEDFIPVNTFRDWNTGFIGGVGVGVDLNADLEMQFLVRYVTAGTRMESLSTGFGNVGLVSDVNSTKLELAIRLLWQDLF